jgi:cupin 2 domain-containing protein
MNSQLNNIFADLPVTVPAELFETLVQNCHVKIERIISKGQASPLDFWYDQAFFEWVILLQGHARLQFAQERTIITLTAGDYLLIPAHKKHRVDWTDPDIECIWLAIHLYENPK